MNNITIHIHNNSKNYPIFIGSHLLERLSEFHSLDMYSKILVITDEIVAPLFLDKLLTSLPKKTHVIILPTGEKEKNLNNCQKIWTKMTEINCDRTSLIINLGGGVIGDLGGFAASTYMRGIHVINIPTTLLSQIDESVGGKTGINLFGIKNLIGTFYQPDAVMIDTTTLRTLPKRQFLSGFVEIIKHGLIKDKPYFEKVTSKDPLAFNENELVEIITKSCQIKAIFVEADETENGIRKIVNFGHTIGHALEALSLDTDTPLLHGEAVAIGMRGEAKISRLLGMITDNEWRRIEQALLQLAIPLTTSKIPHQNILRKITHDKKSVLGKVQWTLLEGIGDGVVGVEIEEKVIKEALTYIQT